MRIRKIVIISIVLIAILTTPSCADFGGFESYESYDSGSSWDRGSSWSSSSDSRSDSSWFWGDSSSSNRRYDKDGYDQYGYDRYGYDRYGNKKNENSLIFEIILLVGAIVAVSVSQFFSRENNKSRNRRNSYNISQNNLQENTSGIRAVDANFNEDEFKTWVTDVFIRLQYAWSNMQEETIKSLETPELYAQHSKILMEYKINREINRIENVSVDEVRIVNYYQVSNNDVITIAIKAQMIDYMMSEETKMVIRGNSTEFKTNTYKMIFTRPIGFSGNSEWILSGMSKI